jgi:hypothetical protein
MRLTTVHSMTKVRRDEPFPNGAEAVVVKAARNQVALGQVVLRASEDIRQVTVAAGPLTGPPGSRPLTVELAQAAYVEVREPTTPAFGPGWYPDALLPVATSLDLAAEANQSLWLRIRVPEAQQAGHYRGQLEIGGRSIPVSVEVWDVTLPRAGHCLTAFAIWYDQLFEHYGVTPASAEAAALAEQFYWFQVDHRLPPDDLPVSADLSAAEWLAEAERFLGDSRVVAYRIPFRADDPERTRQIVAGLRERRWLDRGYFYLDEIDEPTAGGTAEPVGGEDRVRALCELLEDIAPGVPHLVTAEPVPELEGAVRTWVPLFDRFDPDDAEVRARRGERFWWYGCILPTHPYPTYHIDDDLLAARIVPWMMHRYRIVGSLYWSTTIYRKWAGDGYVDRDPWADPVAWPGANGDGFLVYPGPDGPVPSLRLEAIRAGQEDYELLWLLERALEAAADRAGIDGFDACAVMEPLHARLFGSTSDFTRDPRRLDAVRAEVVAQLVRLRQPDATPDLDGTAAHDPHPSADKDAVNWIATTLDPRGWRAHRAEVEVRGDRLEVSAERAGDDTPHLIWRGDPALEDGDVLEFEVENPGVRSFALYVAFHRDDGVRHEAARAMAVAGARRTGRVPLRLALFPPRAVSGVEIGIMHHQPPADLVIIGVRVSRLGRTQRRAS